MSSPKTTRFNYNSLSTNIPSKSIRSVHNDPSRAPSTLQRYSSTHEMSNINHRLSKTSQTTRRPERDFEAFGGNTDTRTPRYSIGEGSSGSQQTPCKVKIPRPETIIKKISPKNKPHSRRPPTLVGRRGSERSPVNRLTSPLTPKLFSKRRIRKNQSFYTPMVVRGYQSEETTEEHRGSKKARDYMLFNDFETRVHQKNLQKSRLARFSERAPFSNISEDVAELSNRNGGLRRDSLGYDDGYWGHDEKIDQNEKLALELEKVVSRLKGECSQVKRELVERNREFDELEKANTLLSEENTRLLTDLKSA